MIEIAFHRFLSGFVACSAVGLSGWERADHGRQDKSAASGRAHVAGWIGDFRRLTHPAAGPFTRNINDFNAATAIPVIGECALSHDGSKLFHRLAHPNEFVNHPSASLHWVFSPGLCWSGLILNL
jgi:hypothetical protein